MDVTTERWELYRLLSEPARLRLLALTAVEELSIGELAELLGESQPNVSRHVSALRRVGLLRERKHGTRVYVKIAPEMKADAFIADAVDAGDGLVDAEGGFQKLDDLVLARELPTREFFSSVQSDEESMLLPAEMGAYLAVLAPLMPNRELAVDVGTGDGRSLELLAPLFRNVIAIEREEAQIKRADLRAKRRDFRNVTLVQGGAEDEHVHAAVLSAGGADLVFASRVLHHAPRPQSMFTELAKLARPGGAVVCLDYLPHDDERMRTERADLWLGFSREELPRLAKRAGLVDVQHLAISPAWNGKGPDHHLAWHAVVAKRSHAEAASSV